MEVDEGFRERLRKYFELAWEERSRLIAEAYGLKEKRDG